MIQQVPLEQIDGLNAFGGIIHDIEQRVVNADYQRELTGVQQVIANQEAAMFSRESDSNGNPWAELKPSTIKRKVHSRILFETGALKESLIHIGGSGNIAVCKSRDLLFGTGIEYAAFHQDGTSKMLARPPVGLSEETINDLANTIADSTVEKMKYIP